MSLLKDCYFNSDVEEVVRSKIEDISAKKSKEYKSNIEQICSDKQSRDWAEIGFCMGYLKALEDLNII